MLAPCNVIPDLRAQTYPASVPWKEAAPIPLPTLLSLAPHNSPKRQLSNVHKGFQSHLGSILPQLFKSHNGAIATKEYRRLIYLITGESDVGEII